MSNQKIHYAKMNPVSPEVREWPAKKLSASPSWCAVDLRDGNQALPNPMTPEQKLEYFKLLTNIGFKEIEIGFPSASEDDFQFCRKLIEENLIPDDVIISVLVQARSHLIKRTIESLIGVKRAVIHLYIATSELHMKYVFNMDNAQVLSTAIESTNMIKNGTAEFLKGSAIGLEFSPEEFTDTDPGFAREICEAVVKTWNPPAGEKVIINLPMTVERRMPNEYADMIEDFIRRYKCNDRSIISLHAHNDMGCAVSATMMALLAGAERVEGTLLGHGERTGNVDLITIALNLHYMGINTGLDFSHLPETVETVERITNIPVHARHPYAGELVFTAFSGSHQDAINKGLMRKDELASRFGGWKIPYLHVDPSELGRSFEKFIRINSQSGKGGIAFILERDHNIRMPKWMHASFAFHVQKYADEKAKEVSSDELIQIFKKTYLEKSGKLKLINYWPRPSESDPSIIEGELHAEINGIAQTVKASGNGPISALAHALLRLDGVPEFIVEQYAEDSMGSSENAEGICFLNIKTAKNPLSYVGVGTDPNVMQAAAKALVNGINSLLEK
jgi:2-isopropylmalate synthase